MHRAHKLSTGKQVLLQHFEIRADLIRRYFISFSVKKRELLETPVCTTVKAGQKIHEMFEILVCE